MRPELLLLLPLLVLMPTCSASEESCIDRCDNGFDATKQCQCDSMCKYYESCCADYDSVCEDMTRGDTFPAFPEDEDKENSTEESPSPEAKNTNQMPLLSSTIKPLTTTFTPALPSPDADAELCSGKAFDSFMQLKNGSIYAFRGKYFFELDAKLTAAGYPRLIEDVWGIKGPIDAAFTRINCQGKTYIFKGNQYWRFDNGVLDEGFPRNISVGFENIPDDLDAAFATPAYNYRGIEKVFFFKGDWYYQYEFKHQPSHKECIQMTRSSPSALFRRYTNIYHDRWAQHFSQLYSDLHSHPSSRNSINENWIGIKAPVDAVLAGRLYVPPRHVRLSERRRDHQQQWDQQWGQQWDQQWGQQWGQQWDQQWGQQWNQQQRGQRRRQNRSPSWDVMAKSGINIGLEYAQTFVQNPWRDQDRQRNGYRQQYDQEYRYNPLEDATLNIFRRRRPLQSVYFFKGDQYYRVNLKTKLVDRAFPPYPRSIAKYWLGCSEQTGAEKR